MPQKLTVNHLEMNMEMKTKYGMTRRTGKDGTTRRTGKDGMTGKDTQNGNIGKNGKQKVNLWSLPKGSRCWLALWGTPWIGSPDITSMNHGYHGKSQILVNKFTNCQLSIFEKHLLCLRLEIVPNLSGPHEHSNTG